MRERRPWGSTDVRHGRGRAFTRFSRARRNRRTVQRAARPAGQVLGPMLKTALSFGLAAATIAGAVLGVGYGWEALSSCEKLQIKDVEVVGNQRAASAEILTYAGLHVGDSILRIDLDATAAGLRRHPWIDRVTIKRRLPDHVTIEVSEHEPRILVSVGEIYVANERGELFKHMSPRDGLQLPVMTGLDRDVAAREPKRAAEIVRRAIELGAVLERDASELGRVDELHWDDVLGWSAVLVPQALRAEPYTLHLGREPEQRLDVALTTVRRLRQLNQRASVVFADAAKNPSFVHVRVPRGSSNAETLIATAR